MTLFKRWFHKKEPKVFEAKLPGQEIKPAIEPNSPTWKFLEDWSETERKKLRRKNDSPKTDWDMTNYIRGQLKCIDDLMNLVNGGRKTTAPPPPPSGILSRLNAGQEE